MKLDSRIKQILKTSILFALLIFFMWLAFRGVNFADLWSELKNTNYLYAFAGGLMGVLVSNYFRALRWRYLLDPLKENISMKSMFPPIMIGYMLNLIIPKGGEISRPVMLAKKENISKGAAFGTIIAERIFDLLSLLISFGLCLFIFRDRLSNAFSDFDISSIALYTSIIVFAMVVVILLIIFNIEKSEVIIENITKKILPARFQKKIHSLFISIINGFLFIKRPRTYFPIFILSVAVWICYGISTWLTFLAFDFKLGLFDANLILTLITFAMFLPLPGNSAGAFHFICGTAMVKIYGIDKEAALGFATVSHLMGLVLMIIFGAYYFFKENYKLKELESEKIE